MSRWSRAWWHLQGWLLVIAVGICSSLSGAGLDVGVQGLSSIRFGICKPSWWIPLRHCQAPETWVYWEDGYTRFAYNVGFGTLLAQLSGTLVYLFAPAAAGSGIPEVKTILNGFVMADVVSLRTLLIKIPGLMLSVAAGMSLGKEGPLVHVAVCWAQLLSRFFPQFSNESKRRELFSAAAAAGVSTAFGAPLGGVLFSLEEVSSFFPSRTLIKSFTAAMAAAIVLSVLNTTNTKGLTLFSVEYSKACHPVEYLIFAGLGVAGGLVGAFFNAVNVRWSAFRMKPAFRKQVHPVLEVTCIALITLLTSFPVAMTRVLSSDAIHALFEACDAGSGHELRGHIGLCTKNDEYAPVSAKLLFELLLAALIRLLQTILTFGVPCPAGLFVPSLFTGAAIGRCVGVLAGNHEEALFPRTVEPGVYAMVGAAAVLGGVCRVTISLVAIMLELTGGMTYIVPFMIAVLIAKLVGDTLNEGIYDLYIVLKGYPFLQEDLDVTFTERCCDIMESGLTKLDISLEPCFSDLSWLLQNFHFPGYPVVMRDSFMGYVKREHLRELLGHLATMGRTEEELVTPEELLRVTDRNVMRMSPDASLTQAHKVFKQLGCKRIFLVGSMRGNDQDLLQGMLSKKNFLHFLKSGKIGHMRDYPNSIPYFGGSASRRNTSSSLAQAAGLERFRNTSFAASLLSISRERSGPLQLQTMLRSPEMSASSGEEDGPPFQERSDPHRSSPRQQRFHFRRALSRPMTWQLKANRNGHCPLRLVQPCGKGWTRKDCPPHLAPHVGPPLVESRGIWACGGCPANHLAHLNGTNYWIASTNFGKMEGICHQWHLRPHILVEVSTFWMFSHMTWRRAKSAFPSLEAWKSRNRQALQQRCAELEALVTELKRTKRRTSKPTSTSSTVSLPGTPGGTCTFGSSASPRAAQVFAGFSMAWSCSSDIDNTGDADSANCHASYHHAAVKWYFEAGWLRKEDTAELSRRGCDILFFKNSSCSCADEILSSMAGIHHIIYADADWTLIKDPKMKANSMHYTAWSQHRELRTAADLRPRHLPFLNMLLLEGTKAVIAAHPDLRSEDDISVFVHFPPNIFRLHVHFVSANRTMWAPPDEVFLLKKLVKSLELSKGNPIHSSWKFVHHSSLNCEPSTAPEQDTEDVGKIASRVEQAEHRAEVLAAELAAASARLAEAEDGANAKVANAAASLRASEAACLAAVEAAQDANEARRRVEEELTKEAAVAKKASSDEMAEAAAARGAMEEMRSVKLRAATFRSKALAMQEMRADSQELAMLASCFAAWRLWRADNRISSAQDVIEAQANEIGRVASLQARQRVRHGIESALKSTEVEVMHTVIAAWRTSLCTRRTVGSLQAALFAEEADRASALRAQRSECDVLLLQAEARHRIALQKLRTELAEAQAKQKEASAAERLALQAAVRAESIGWPSPLDLPDTEEFLKPFVKFWVDFD
eukprot:symbB.v1.2.022706.t3/scaffold2028.1/size91989/3